MELAPSKQLGDLRFRELIWVVCAHGAGGDFVAAKSRLRMPLDVIEAELMGLSASDRKSL